MMTSRTNGAQLGLPDRFVAVEIETKDKPAFDAAQYSFFGDLSAADSGLEGALEDGLETPLDEDGLFSQEYGLQIAEEDAVPLEAEEDLSVASMFRNQLKLETARAPPAPVDQDEDAAMNALLTDPLAEARKQLRDDYYDHRDLPAELYSPSGPDTRQAAAAHSLFGASSDSYSPYEGQYQHLQAQALGSQQPQQPHGNGDGSFAAAPQASQPQAGAPLLQMLKKPGPQPGKAMTLEELEARMLSSAAAAATEPSPPAGAPAAAPPPGPQQPQHMQGLFHHPAMPGQPIGLMPPPPGMAPPPGYHHHPNMNILAPPPSMHPHGGMPQRPMHAQHGPMGPLPPHMMLAPPGSPGAAGMYPPPPPGGPHLLPGMQLHPSHNGGHGPGMMMPPPHQQQQHPHHHGHHQGMPPPPGAMVPPPYGPGGLMPRPMQYGPPGMAGPPPSFMHDGYQVRPMAGPMGAPGPMLGPGPARPAGPYGPAQGPAHPPAAPASQRPPAPAAAAPPPPPSSASAGQRPAGVLGAGAAAGQRPAPQARTGAGPDFGRQFARGSPGPTGAPVAPSSGAPAALAAAAAAAGRAGGAVSGPGGRLGGKWMRPEDVEYVVRSMLYSVANGVPYVEDYYFQAFVHKYVSRPSRQQLSPGAFPMAAPFVPETLRDLSEEQMHMMRLDPSARVKFVEGIQGLGKIVLSNIRTPKILMDLSDRGSAGGAQKPRGAGEAGGDEAGRAARPLEQEPLLAARIMIEDCMNLLLDLDDIDRLATHMASMAQAHQRAAAVAAAMPLPGAAAVVAAAAAGAAAAATAAAGSTAVAPYGPASAAPPPTTQLRQRRELLLAGINGAFRLPGAAAGAAADMDVDGGGGAAGGTVLGDGVLLRILALSKGRSVVARALLAIAPPASLAVAAGAPGGSKTAATAAQQPSRQPSQDAAGAASSSSSSANNIAEAAAAAAAPSADDAVADSADTSTGVLGAGAPSPYVLLWATLRNAWTLFGSSLQQGLDAAAERPMLEATARLAAAMRDALLRLPTARDVVAAAVAFNAGCHQHAEALSQGNAAAASSMEATLLPLAQTRAFEAPAAGTLTPPPSAWLGEALAALVTRASQLGLSAATAGEKEGEEEQQEVRGKAEAEAVNVEWSREFGELHERMSRHLATLGGIHSMAVASGNAEALAVVRALSCRQLVNAMMPHASNDQLQQLRGAMQAFAA